ncbi:hypothetical protein DFH28DRAFT_888397 [Melampsora americana]|nr:hypothetical protein DFH28DRAFT_888397 [Melampsora americana]
MQSGNSFIYSCRLCRGRTMKERSRHQNSAKHKANVSVHEASIALELENQHHVTDEESDEVNDAQFAGFEANDSDDESETNALVGYSEPLMKLLTGPYSESEKSENSEHEEERINPDPLDLDALIQQKLEEMIDVSQTDSDSPKSNEMDKDDENLQTEPNQKSPGLDSDWYPFTKEVSTSLQTSQTRLWLLTFKTFPI